MNGTHAQQQHKQITHPAGSRANHPADPPRPRYHLKALSSCAQSMPPYPVTPTTARTRAWHSLISTTSATDGARQVRSVRETSSNNRGFSRMGTCCAAGWINMLNRPGARSPVRRSVGGQRCWHGVRGRSVPTGLKFSLFFWSPQQ